MVDKAADNARAEIDLETNTVSSDDIEAQLAQLRDDVASLAETLATFGAERAQSYKRRAGALAEDAAEMSRDAVRTAKAEFNEMERSLEESIRSKPLQAVGIAAGIGFVAALLTRR